MVNRKLLAIITTLLCLFVLVPPASAQGSDDRVFFGRDLILTAEQQIDGDVVVYGGEVDIPADAEINGDLAVFGGNISLNGTVDGDIAVLGGNITLGETAEVDGGIALAGGEATVADGADIADGIIDTSFFNWGDLGNDIPLFDGEAQEETITDNAEEGRGPPPPPVPPADPGHGSDWDDDDNFGPHWDHDQPFNPVEAVLGFFLRLLQFVGMLVALAAVSWLVAAFLPEQMKVVSEAVVQATPQSFGVGLVTGVVAVVIGLILLITICLAPITFIGWLALGIASLFGWIVIGQLIGDRLLTAAGYAYPNFTVSTVVGTLVLTLISRMPVLSWIPCFGFIFWLFGLIVSLLGLGAVILTRFGTQPYSPDNGLGGGGRRPYNPSPAGGDDDLGVNSASDEELRARIKQALAEADAAMDELDPDKDNPDPDAPADDSPPPGEDKPPA